MVRTDQDINDFAPLKLESVQGRFWCKIGKGKVPKGNYTPSKDDLARDYSVENATVIFENDMVLLNRHMFVKKTGARLARPENCFFEHISSNRLFRVAQVKYLELKRDKKGNVDELDYMEKDFAFARLQNKIQGTTPIRESDMLINADRPDTTKLTVVSNYATNAPHGNPEALTIANCSIQEHFSNHGKISNFVGTDCNTGTGSSAGQLYVNEADVPKLLGIVQGEYAKKDIPAGSGYQSTMLSTNVIMFTSDVIELAKQLPEIQGLHAEK